FFTLLGGLLLASSINVKAEGAAVYSSDDESSVTVVIKNANSYTSNLTKDADGNWILADFLESGVPFSFKFDKPEAVGDKSAIDITSKVKVEDNYYYLLDSEGQGLEGRIVNYQGKGTEIKLFNPYIYNTLSYSYVKKLDAEKDGYEYEGIFTVKATDETSRSYTLYLSFRFNDLQSGDEPGNDEYPVTVTIKNANPYTSNLTKDADGIWTLADFLESGVPFSFKFDKPEAVGDKSAIDITSKVKVEDNYYYLLDSEGQGLEGRIVNYQGKGTEIKLFNPYIYNTLSYSYVKKLDAEKDGYEYEGIFTVKATDETSRSYTLYLSFRFNDTQNGGTSSAIEVSVENAPVEYYNLQGVKVAEPSNGIFIRKQGSKTTKVAIK
ncbi:MAG: hypothetical protein K2N25_00080, partial [Muribaculaceae bacterium]|nr:hypothetical protein [Muribaculaceae bacterium]